MPKAHIITHGCQMNEYDTHLVESQLVAAGVELVASVDSADLVLINTCAVRGKPVDKVKSLLGNLRKLKQSRGLVIGMMGCLAQLEEGQAIAEKYQVDILLGPGALTDIGAALASNQRYWSMAFRDELLEAVPPSPVGKLSAHLTIMRGCDHHCTYCIVPTTRGPQVSRHPDLIMRELDSMLAAGVVEVTLLGQNVNAYGKDKGNSALNLPSFAQLLRMVAASGMPRIKFTTSHPMDFSDDIIEAIAESPNICKYVHLPVQAGSNAVLKRMGREYTIEWYLERIEKMRSLMPNLVLSTDIIVGFPSETEADFAETLALYDQIGYDTAFMFIYSARPGTPSYKHFDDQPHSIKTERLQRLIERQKHWSQARNGALVGQEVEALIRGPAYEPSFSEGHTAGNHPILLPAAEAPLPGLYRAVVEHATPHMLFGRVTATLHQQHNLPPIYAGATTIATTNAVAGD
jgi:tRNA-2-methylthio-N6-dimethylallyladenosine synthase